jgi:hypothetical protein
MRVEIPTVSDTESHHKWEQALVALFNLDGWNLEWCGGGMEHYDAKGKTPKGYDCVIEFKLRNKYYREKVLEKFKYEKLMLMNCMRFYFVADDKGNYLYFLDTLQVPEPVKIKCKTTEKFTQRELIDKEFYLLSESQASIINRY